MKRRSTSERLEALRLKERQLIAQRKALEARAAVEATRQAVRSRLVLADALLAWIDADDMAAAVLPRKIRPFVLPDRWPEAENLFSQAKR